jgi:hypothetical protein
MVRDFEEEVTTFRHERKSTIHGPNTGMKQHQLRISPVARKSPVLNSASSFAKQRLRNYTDDHKPDTKVLEALSAFWSGTRGVRIPQEVGGGQSVGVI